MEKNNLATKQEKTWCPGCLNNLILEAVQKTLDKLIENGAKLEDFVMVTGIGCHAKIFDYLNISGFYGLHGRVLPAALGIKLANPNLKILGFAGDADTYAEGMGHFIHAGRYNADMTFIVHDNQSFSLTTGQASPTTQEGYKSKVEPFGQMNHPINPIALALGANFSFIARTNAKDIEYTAEILTKAIQHPGFAFVEIIQDCLVFNPDMNNKDSLMYKIPDNQDSGKAWALAGEWDYNSKSGKIPLGVIFQETRPTLDERWLQLADLKKQGLGWKDLK